MSGLAGEHCTYNMRHFPSPHPPRHPSPHLKKKEKRILPTVGMSLGTPMKMLQRDQS